MKFARKIILHLPVSDEAFLGEFVEQCLRGEVSLIAVVGPGCARMEDLIDEIIVGDGTTPIGSSVRPHTATSRSTML